MNYSSLNNDAADRTQDESGVAPVRPMSTGTEPPTPPVREIGGRKDGPEPTRYGDWEKGGRCIDF